MGFLGCLILERKTGYFTWYLHSGQKWCENLQTRTYAFSH